MKINDIKFLQFMAFSLACGLFSSIPTCIISCMVCLFFLVPLMPIAFIPCWLTGAILGWLTSRTAATLPLRSYIFIVMSSLIIGFLILHQWLYPNDIVSCLIWSLVFGGVFAVCSLPASLYVKKGLYLKYLCPQFLKSKVSKPTSSGITISSSLTAMTTLSIPPPYTYGYRCSSGVISV